MESIFDTVNSLQQKTDYFQKDPLSVPPDGITLPSKFLTSFKEYQYADYQYECIKEEIESFQNSLDDEHEIAIQLASFGQSILMLVSDIGYVNPNLMLFYGTVNGRSSQLIQHVNQLNFMLQAIPKEDPNKPARRIGFATSNED
ncbi:DUF6173 family protein [Fumia xinanensis]|uniref:Uncharacterized protein n=1 Tax=Fumia xinanensis TaxID=2763659 RepID=A0A926E440_9FIRM|nr:DUF6173 family protein [Fumia xinanensis]MBC8558866.1 hypothetical protein [Fumia xinanensis]